MKNKVYDVGVTLRVEVPANTPPEVIKREFIDLISYKGFTPAITEVKKPKPAKVTFLEGKNARRYFQATMIAHEVSGKYEHPEIAGPVIGMFKDNGYIIVFDNTKGQLYQEEFTSIDWKKALKWLYKCKT